VSPNNLCVTLAVQFLLSRAVRSTLSHLHKDNQFGGVGDVELLPHALTLDFDGLGMEMQLIGDFSHRFLGEQSTAKG
jgi:hypothetical protein